MTAIGILAEHDGNKPHPQFRRYNLLYGFNGSGKSTLSRMFASLQAGTRDPHLPPTSTFEFELDDGTALVCPERLNGFESRVLVFNTDFVEQNLQWSNARANPVFYIGKEQASLADELAASRGRLPAAAMRRTSAAEAVRSAERALQMFRRERARLIAERLRLRGRKYEAPQLKSDYEQLELDENCKLDDSTLDAFGITCSQEDPPAKIDELSLKLDNAASILFAARGVCGIAPSTAVLTELQAHPGMLVWVMQGYKYHADHRLSECLFCTNTLSTERLQAIQGALDGGVDMVIAAIDGRRDDVYALRGTLDAIEAPNPRALRTPHRKNYEVALATYNAALNRLKQVVEIAARLVDEKRKAPGTMNDVSSLPNQRQCDRIVSALVDAQASVNTLINAHNLDVDNFTNLQEEARLAIRKHYLAEGLSEYQILQRAQDSADAETRAADTADVELRAHIEALESQIREHGPAADAINRLLLSYLGHPELSIAAVDNGYEFRRNGKRITGLPSEGEKTAIALCYFLSTLESERRRTRDLIVVVDDPISSLDSRSLNFACNLIKSRLSEAAQLFMMTHNQNCLNEFRKAWKSKARPEDGSEPTAALLFLDVTLPKGAKLRTSNIVDLPKFLREYDSEYHYLFHHVLKFAAAQGEYDYAYMMPNVLRRVLEVFLAFRCPGSAGLSSKIEQLCRAYSNLDRDRVVALERLTQVESHSDNLDDLIAFSSMTLEETKDATIALLAVMEHVDAAHLAGLRRICA